MSASLPLDKNRKMILLIIISMAIIPFFFVHSPVSLWGISIFAWLLVGVMILTPIVTLIDLLLSKEQE